MSTPNEANLEPATFPEVEGDAYFQPNNSDGGRPTVGSRGASKTRSTGLEAVVERCGGPVISDFDPSIQRMHEYQHRPGLWRFKETYSVIFTSLGTRELIYLRSSDSGSSVNPTDLHDHR